MATTPARRDRSAEPATPAGPAPADPRPTGAADPSDDVAAAAGGTADEAAAVAGTADEAAAAPSSDEEMREKFRAAMAHKHASTGGGRSGHGDSGSYGHSVGGGSGKRMFRRKAGG